MVFNRFLSGSFAAVLKRLFSGSQVVLQRLELFDL